MIPAEEKVAKVKIFNKEEAFCQYLDRFLSKNGYVLVVTSPLKRKQPGGSITLTGAPAGRIKDERRPV